MKVTKRISILFVLVFGLIAMQGTKVDAFDQRQDCFNGCVSAYGGCANAAQQTLQMCDSGCATDAIGCGQMAQADYVSCSAWCSFSYPCCPGLVNLCIENCEGELNGQLSICAQEESDCRYGPYTGCENEYDASMSSCAADAGACETLCEILYP
jgi:hypothetical protein